MAFNRGKIGFAPAADGSVRPSYFVPEMDGQTFASLEALSDWHWQNMPEDPDEFDADAAYERHLETNDQYRWEVEEDERRAAAFSADFDRWQESIWCPKG